MKKNYLLSRSWGNRSNEYETFNKQHLIDLLVDRDVEINTLSAELDYYKNMHEKLNEIEHESMIRLVQSGEYSPKVLVGCSEESYEV